MAEFKNKMNEHQNHLEHQQGIQHTETKAKDYLPLLYIFLFIAGATFVELRFFTRNFAMLEIMRNFMGFFFLVFGFFKAITWRDFALTYSSYDIIAKRIMAYAYIYPAVELALGTSYLLNYHPITTNAITLLIMAVGSVGVAQNILSKNKIQCACLGSLIKVPLSKISLLEDVLMAAMALVTLTLLF